MRKLTAHAFRALVLACAVTGLVMLIGPAIAAGDAHTVAQSARAFHPAEVAIARSQTPTFADRDDFIHQIYVKAGCRLRRAAPGQDVAVTFPVSGTFEVRRHIHPEMGIAERVK